jgi:hypothetical protein
MKTKLSPDAKLVKIIRHVRWMDNRPPNGQAQAWTSFSIVVVEDKGTLLWGPSCRTPEYILEGDFYPLPEGVDSSTLDLLPCMEKHAPWGK